MSVKKYHNKYRAYFTLAGKRMQVYFDTQIEAQNMVKLARDIERAQRPVWAQKTKKRSNAKHDDLPVGFYQSRDLHIDISGGNVIYRYIKCVFIEDSKTKSKQCSFGGNGRTRAQAILELVRRVEQYLKDNR
jgi:hypothetical protein